MDVNSVSGESMRDDFLELLVTQLRNQDPLDPVSQEDFTSQLSQFSMLEQLETLNANFSDMLGFQELAQGASLIGRTVSYRTATSNGLIEGRVESIERNDEKVFVTVEGGAKIQANNIQAVMSN